MRGSYVLKESGDARILCIKGNFSRSFCSYKHSYSNGPHNDPAYFVCACHEQRMDTAVYPIFNID